MSDAKNTTGNFFKAYGNPSMKQSLQISNNLYSSVHLGIDKGINLKNEFMSKLIESVAITSFDFFLKNDNNNWLFTIHNYQNYKNYFIGLETIHSQKYFFNNKLSFTTRAMVWAQPENLSFYASKADVGGLVSVKTNANFGVFSHYIELSAKTAGWVVGEVYQDKNMGVNFGV